MPERRLIKIGGIVQGVGFRPFVHRLAARHRLNGFVRNQSGDVLIEAEGEPTVLERFLEDLVAQSPPLSQIDGVSHESLPLHGDREFLIQASRSEQPGRVLISPDVATCPECRAELLDPANRRYRYPFLNCTNCGPRLTIIQGAPYDRALTTMAPFVMCAECRDEYENPANRRFHAQPTACAVCGPHVQLRDATGELTRCDDPVTAFAESIRHGRIGAMKGLGGYHLVCDASHAPAVHELRKRKHRDEKPFAVMVQSLDAAERICQVSAIERKLLSSWRSPIVLLKKRSDNVESVADAVAPGNPCLGVMLPYTPLHHLLLRELEGVPLVMTSGNRSDEPIASRDDDAIERLAGIADLFLTHDRPIHVRCDDSVTRVVAGVELPVRRSRGYAPQPIKLPLSCPASILAVGGQLKATFALGSGEQAILSHHLGDLDHYQAYQAFEKDVTLYEQLFAVRPQAIAHDLHPDYASTRYAVKRAERDVALVPVQHHHAHMASCMAEHGLDGSVIGVTFDGAGLGTDGGIWGGEFLVGGYRTFHRAAHLRYVGQPGGEQATREPWRMAVAHHWDAGGDGHLPPSRLSPKALRMVTAMLQRRLNTPLTSSMGRLFDAVASLAGVRDRVSYEGQAAMELEWLAADAAPQGRYPWRLLPSEGTESTPPSLSASVIDTRPLIRAVTRDVHRGIDRRIIARRFHSTVVDIVVGVCRHIRSQSGFDRVVLSGGVFMNALLIEEATQRLADARFDVYRHRQVPPNDGGLSLGQLAIAAAVLQDRIPDVSEIPATTEANDPIRNSLVEGGFS